MFCRNCGKEINANAFICPFCGVKTAEPGTFCSNCGSNVSPQAEICLKCGVRLSGSGNKSDKDFVTTLLLCWFLGVFGVHRFYVGDTTNGLIQLFTLGGCGIWALIDLILIISGSFKDADGRLVSTK